MNEQKELRSKLAKLLTEASEIANGIKSGGWEVPANYISEQCSHWAKQYERN